MTTTLHQESVHRELVISSVPDEIARVEQFIDHLNEDLRFKEDVYGNILIAVTEAVNNSIKHGNAQSEAKKVRITGDLEKGYRLTIRVEDEGEGFDYDNLEDPTDPLNLLKEQGRGVFVMRQLSDKLSFKGDGNIVEMQFDI